MKNSFKRKVAPNYWKQERNKLLNEKATASRIVEERKLAKELEIWAIFLSKDRKKIWEIKK